jgi:glyoxylase-like metal-dependent hydrolase (beta-lactamase superfamily II)
MSTWGDMTTLRIDGIDVISLWDAADDMVDPDILDPTHGPTDEVWAPYQDLYPGVFGTDDRWRLISRATLLRAEGWIFLVDTGVGGPASPTMSWYRVPGNLMGSLAEASISAGDVDMVIITHVHDDHIGGTVTADGEPAFPNARYVVNRLDLEWLRALAREDEDNRAVWDGLLAPLESGGVLRAIDGHHELASGIRIRHLPGHTPGHQIVYVDGGDASLIVSGDTINHPAQLHDASLATGPDEDAAVAANARAALIREVTDTDRVLAPTHFAEPFGRIASGGRGRRHRWLPLP